MCNAIIKENITDLTAEQNKKTTTLLNLLTMTIKESNLTINVKDLDKSISFYQSIGMTVKNRWGNHYAQLEAPGILIGLHPTREANLKGGSGNLSIGFKTDNLEEAKAELQQLSVNATERQEEGGQFLHFTDPDGTALYIIKPKW